MLDQPIAALTFSSIEALVQAGSLRESRTLEFKSQPVGRSDEEKREFLADISSFANTAGGDVIFGVHEEGGLAVSVPGLNLEDPDAEVLRLENILRSGLEPRLPGITLSWLPREDCHGVLLIRVPRSWAAPHRVMANSRFFGRNSAGKYPLDVHELRSSFVAAEGAIARLRSFRQERVLAIEANDTPLHMRPFVPRAVMHIVPFSSYLSGELLDLSGNLPHFEPMGSYGSNRLFTLEGAITYSCYGDNLEEAGSYVLLYRSGIIEAVAPIGDRTQGQEVVWTERAEVSLSQGLDNYRAALSSLGVEPPYALFVSFVDVQGCKLDARGYYSIPPPPQRKNVLLLPEVILNGSGDRAAKTLKPVYDQLWNAFGYGGTPNYDAEGNLLR